MWLTILIFVVVVGGAAFLIDRRTRRTGHRVPNGGELDRRIPNGTADNSRAGSTGNPIVRSRFDEVDPRS